MALQGASRAQLVRHQEVDLYTLHSKPEAHAQGPATDQASGYWFCDLSAGQAKPQGLHQGLGTQDIPLRWKNILARAPDEGPSTAGGPSATPAFCQM
jgi:hypothetical protein